LASIVTALVTFAVPVAAGTAPAHAADPTTTTSIATAPPATPDIPSDKEVEVKRAQVQQTQADAAAAAQAYNDAIAALALIEERVKALQERIPRVEAHIRDLKKVLAERAAVLYRGGGGANGLTVISEVSSTGDFLAGGRTARLADAAQQSTDAQVDELKHTRQQLVADRADLKASQAQQEQLAADANNRAQSLTTLLTLATADLQVAESKQSYAKYVAAMENQRAAAAEAGDTPDAQKAVGDPSLAARVPVANMVCPVNGPVAFSDDFGQPRSGWRVHQGNDIFAARGTPDVAVGDGVIKQSHNTLGGNAMWEYTWDGNAFYYAHMDAYEGTFDANGMRVVRKGEVIGYVGNTGNAAGGPTHTHFEIHPGNIGPIDPYPLLRQMCAPQLGLQPPK
jgi:murein DD-endopeptidase MepM/ murein hydrolase activator NlpD